MPIMRCQPSTRTNSMILNGSEIVVGGNIIMPIALVTLLITISKTKNGKKIMNPIRKAVFNSLIMNAGNNACIGMS